VKAPVSHISAAIPTPRRGVRGAGDLQFQQHAA
jgi:hypothetical protein